MKIFIDTFFADLLANIKKMKTLNRFSAMAISALAITLGLFVSSFAHAATSPTLVGALGYSVLGGATVTNTGTTTTNGAVGVSPGTAITGQETLTAGGGIDDGESNASAIAAQADRLSAFGALDQTCTTTYAGTKDLVGLNLVPGVYCANAFTLTGTLNLSGTTGVWIFKTATTLITSPGSSVTGGDPCNVWWRIGVAATLDTTTSFLGNIVTGNDADTTALGTGATLNGRVLGGTGQTVTLAGNTITGPTCTSSALDSTLDSTSASQDIQVKKTASDYKLQSGPDKVTFTYKVTNEGNTPLTDVSLKDDKCDDVNFKSGDDNNDDILDLTEEWKYTCEKTVKETETNTATAKGHANGVEVKDTDTAKVTVSTPELPNAGFAPENLWDIISRQISLFF